MQSQIFHGLKVVDLSTVLAGPSIGTFFAELGAEVTKIENPITSGDATRSWKLTTEDANSTVSAYFASVNYGKKYLTLNLNDPKDSDKIMALIKTSDVLITNFKKGDDEKFGLSADRLRALNPRLIVGRVTGFEHPFDRVAYDVVLQAENGYMQMNGTVDSGPVKMPVAMIDMMAAHQVKEGILCAMIQLQKTGKGSIVECSLEKAGLAALTNQATNYLMANFIPGRMGTLHPNVAPYGDIFSCSDDKLVVLAIGSDKQFSKLVELLGKPSIASNSLFKHNPDRVNNRAAMQEFLQPLFRKKSRNEWMELFNRAKVPAGAIQSMDEVMSSATAQSMILEEVIDGVATKRLQSAAFKMIEL